MRHGELPKVESPLEEIDECWHYVSCLDLDGMVIVDRSGQNDAYLEEDSLEAVLLATWRGHSLRSILRGLS